MIEIQFRREQNTMLRAFTQSAKVIASTGRHIENHIWLEPGNYPNIFSIYQIDSMTNKEVCDSLTVRFTLPKPSSLGKVTG